MHVIKRSYLSVPRVLASDLLFVVVVAVVVENIFLVKKTSDATCLLIMAKIRISITAVEMKRCECFFYIIVSMRFQNTNPLSLM